MSINREEIAAEIEDGTTTVGTQQEGGGKQGVLRINDVENAKRLVKRFSDVAKYVPQKRTWISWDKKAGVWKYDILEQAANFGKVIVEGLFDEIKKAELSTDDKTKLYRDAIKHQTGGHVRECVRLAQSDSKIAMLASNLDNVPDFLNCVNGVVDLRTGALIPHEGDNTRGFLLTKQCPVRYDPEARSAEWEDFLNVALQGDQELIRYVQKAAGYSLTGDCQDEVFFFIHGQTRTGKSTFISAISSVLGPYHLSTNFESFLQSRNRDGKGPSEDVARMRGARMISAIETSEGRKMDMGLMKKLTGRDKLTARELYEKSFEFDMTAKLWLVANDPPIVSEEDEAIWARLIELPFTYRVPPEQINPGLKVRLSDPELNGVSILNWMVKGCQMWREEGALTGKKPEKVEKATQAYRIRMNPVSSFIEHRFIRDENAPPYNAERLYAEYVGFFEDSNSRKWEKPIPKITFTKKMKDLGFTWVKDSYNPEYKRQEDVWSGLRLKTEQSAETQGSGQQLTLVEPPNYETAPARDEDVPPPRRRAA